MDGVVVIVIVGFVRARAGLLSNIFPVVSINGVSQGLHGFKGARFSLSTHDVLDPLSQTRVITMLELFHPVCVANLVNSMLYLRMHWLSFILRLLMLSPASAVGLIGLNWLQSTWRNSDQSSSHAKFFLDNIIGSKNSKAIPLRSVSANVTLESSSEYVEVQVA